MQNRVKSAQKQPAHASPGQGSLATRARNQRRKARYKLSILKKEGILPESANIFDYKEWLSQEDKGASLSTSEPDGILEAKKKLLLEAISSGGVDVDQAIDEQRHTQNSIANGRASIEDHTEAANNGVPTNEEAQSNEASQTVKGSFVVETSEANKATLEDTTMIDVPGVPGSQPMALDPDHTHEADPSFTDKDTGVEGNAVEQAASTEPRRRTRLDIASSRRLLFGSLGLRAPKTAAEEDSIRNKLMEGVKPSIQPQKDSDLPLHAESALDDESWVDKIILRAVECCDEGSELATPPFPFVQGWDRRRLGPNNRGNQKQKSGYGAKKRRVGRDHDYDYEDYQHELEYDDAIDPDIEYEDIVDQHQDRDDEMQAAVDRQLMRDSNSSFADQPQVEDLPEVPTDLSPYEALTKENVEPGAVVVFKQIRMSEATNWSPIVSEYRTAIIDRILETGRLEMTLAYRDRVNQEKTYNPKTGERTYSKFEMPDVGNEDEEADDDGRYLEMGLEEMIEPKLIKHDQNLENEDGQTQATFEQGARVAVGVLSAPSLDVEAAGDIEQLSGAEHIVSSQKSDHSDHAAGLDRFSDAETTSDVEDKRNLVTSEPAVTKPQAPPQKDEKHEKSSPTITVQGLATKDSAQGMESRKATVGKHSKVAGDISEEARREYSRLIKEAGFQSDVNSEVGRDLHGCSSGPSSKSGVESRSFVSLSPMAGTNVPHDLGLPSSQMSHRISVRDSEDDEDEEIEELGEDGDLEPTYDDDEEWRPIVDGDEVEEAQESDGADEGASPSPSYANDIVKPARDLRSSESNLDFGMHSDTLMDTSGKPLESRHDLEDGVRVPENTQRELSPSQRSEPPPILDRASSFNLATDSDEEFPSLTTLLSQTQSQPNPQIFDSDSESNSDAEYSGIPPSTAPLPKTTQTAKHRNQPSLQNGRKSKLSTMNGNFSPSSSPPKSADIKSEKDSVIDFRDLELSKSKPKPKPKYRASTSQIPTNTHIVDLTMSSDLEEDDEGSEYHDDSLTLPTGPGWVRKTRNSYAKGNSWQSLPTERTRSTV